MVIEVSAKLSRMLTDNFNSICKSDLAAPRARHKLELCVSSRDLVLDPLRLVAGDVLSQLEHSRVRCSSGSLLEQFPFLGKFIPILI